MPSRSIDIGDKVKRVVVGIRLFTFKVGNINVNITSGALTGLGAIVLAAVLWVGLSRTAGRCELFQSADPHPSGSVVMQPLPGRDGKYECGTKLRIEALESDQWRFDRWVGGVTPERVNPGTLTLNADRQVVAVFVRR